VVYSHPVSTHSLTSYKNPEHYTAVSNGAVGPSYIAKNGPTVHVVKREAEAEADPALVYNTLPLTYNAVPATTYNSLPVHTYNTLPVAAPAVTYKTAVAAPAVTYNTVAAPAVTYKAVASPVVTYNHAAVATPAVTYKAVTSPVVTYNHAAVATPAVTYNTPVVYSHPVSTHSLTSYKNPEHYTAVSNGAVGPSYIAKNGPTVHVVKREAEAEADPALVYNNLPVTYNTLPATAFNTYNTLPVNTYNTLPVNTYNTVPVSTTYNTLPTPYNTVAGVPYNTHHAVAYTPAGVTHSSNVGICHNSVGQVVPC